MLKQRVGSLTLVPSGGGVFEVIVDGQTLHSKKATGGFPDPATIVEQVRKLG